MSKKQHHDHSHADEHGDGHTCCGGHHHQHGHSHAEKSGGGCCGHGHSHEKDDHSHAACAHSHGEGDCSHEDHHSHAHGCCGHDHDHAHDHAGCCGHDHGDDAEWTRKFFAFLQGVVLLMIGGVMIYFVVSGRIDGRNPNTPYVTGWFKGLALAGGLGLMVMGLFNWITSRRQLDCGHDHSHGDEDSSGPAHVHSHDGSAAGRALTLLVLSGSVAAAAMLTPDGYSGKYAINKGAAYSGDANSAEKLLQTSPEIARAAAAPGGFTLAKVEEYIKRTKEGNFPLSVVNLHYMGADQEYAAVMDGQPVETVGQVVKDELHPGPKNLRVFTMQVTCCAADARPYSIPLEFAAGAPDYVEMGWYKVVGKLEFTQERGMKMARLRVAKPQDMTATIRPDPEKPGY